MMSRRLTSARPHRAKKNNNYYVIIEEGIDGSTGLRRRTSHAAGVSRRAAEHLLAELLEQKRTDTYVEPSRLSLSEYLIDEWLPATGRGTGQHL